MIKKLLLTLLLAFSLSTAFAVETLTQSQTTYFDSSFGLQFALSQNGIGQGFQVTSTAPITKFTFKMAWLTTQPDGTLTGYIYSDDGAGKPNAALATFSNFAANTLTTTATDYEFTGSYTPATSTQYHIVFLWSGQTQGRIQISSNNETNDPNPYANGAASRRATATWTGFADNDMYFKLYQDVTERRIIMIQ